MTKRAIKPTDRFWLVITVDRADGNLATIDPEFVGNEDWNPDCVQAIEVTEADALATLKDHIAEFGGTGFVYACVPRKKVWQPPQPEKPLVRVVDVKKGR